MEMKHFSHDHPLLGLGFTAKQDEGIVTCAGCRSHINGPAFGCKECGFFLHKHCAELSLELCHPLHPTGALKLILCKPYRQMWSLYVCKLCNIYITEPRFVYECNRMCSSDECKFKRFIIHVDCALLESSLKHKNHKQHPLVAYNGFGYRADCSACGADFDLCHDDSNTYYVGRGARFPFHDVPTDLIYRCLECGDRFHKECLDMPQVKCNDRHQHDLTLYLTPMPVNYEEKDYYCDACEEKRTVRAFSYVCKECNYDYICHLRCDFFKNYEENKQKRWERETQEEVQEHQRRLEKIEEKIKSLEKELHELSCDKSRCEESIKKLQEKLRPRLKRKREEIS